MFRDTKFQALLLGSLWLIGCSAGQSFNSNQVEGQATQALDQLNALEQNSTGGGTTAVGHFLVEVDYTRLDGVANLQFQAAEPALACAPVASPEACAVPAFECAVGTACSNPPPCLPTPPPPCQINGNELAVLYGQGDVQELLTVTTGGGTSGSGSGSTGSGSAGSSKTTTAASSSSSATNNIIIGGLNLTTSFQVDDATAQACLTTAANALALNHGVKITGAAVVLPSYGIALPPNLNYNTGDASGALSVVVPSIATGENILDGTLPPALPPFESLDTVVVFSSIDTCVDSGIVVDPPPPVCNCPAINTASNLACPCPIGSPIPTPIGTAIPLTAAQ